MVAIPINLISLDERGVAYIAGTGSKVREIAIETEELGYSPQRIHAAHPHLSLEQIHAALAYYYGHRVEIDAEIRAADAQADAILAEIGEPINMAELAARAASMEKERLSHP